MKINRTQVAERSKRELSTLNTLRVRCACDGDGTALMSQFMLMRTVYK